MNPRDATGSLYMSPLIWLAASAALLVGLGAGWALGISRCRRTDEGDWKTRIAARDNDLQKAQEDLADVTFSLQEAEARLTTHPGVATDGGLTNADPGAAKAEAARERARADALAQRLRTAEADLADFGDPQTNAGPGADPELVRRIEELEVELTALASHRCPDPTAHSEGKVGDGHGTAADHSPSATSPEG